MTSTFTNILVSGSTVTTNLTCDTLQTNQFNILTTDLALGGSLLVNSIVPNAGNIVTIKSTNINLDGNVIIGDPSNPCSITCYGNTTFIDTTNLDIKDSLLRLNKQGTNLTSLNAGLEIEGTGGNVVTYLKTTGSNVASGWMASNSFYSPLITADNMNASNVSLNNVTLSNATVNGILTTGNINVTGLTSNITLGGNAAFSNRCKLEMLGNSGIALSYNTMNNSKDFYIRSGNTNAGLFYYDGTDGSLQLSNKITTFGNAKFGTSKFNSHTFNGNVSIGTLVDANSSVLSFPSVSAKKIALYDTTLNNNQYFGLNASGTELGYNIANVSDQHNFYAGLTSSSKKLLATIEEWGLSVTGNIFTNNNLTCGGLSVSLFSATSANITTLNSSTINNTGNITTGNLISTGLISSNISVGNLTISNTFSTPSIISSTITNSGNIVTGNLTSTGIANITTLNTSTINNSGNITTNGLISSNVTIGNVIINGSFTVPTVTSSIISNSGNITTGNLIGAGIYSTVGNITTLNSSIINNSGNVNTNILNSSFIYNTSNITTGNIIGTFGNINTINATNLNNVSTGNIDTLNSTNLNGTLLTAYQPYITSVGNLSQILMVKSPISLIDTTCNGLPTGSSGAYHQLVFGGRLNYLSQDATDSTISYWGSDGGSGNDPDFEFALKRGRGLLLYNQSTSEIDAWATGNERLRVSGNARITGNVWCDANLFVTGNSSLDTVNSRNINISNGLQINSPSGYNNGNVSSFISFIKGGNTIDCANIQGSTYHFTGDRVINGTFSTATLVQLNHTTSTTLGFSGTIFLDVVFSVTNTLNQTASRSYQLSMTFTKERANTICNCATNIGTAVAVPSSSGATIGGPVLGFNAIAGAVALTFTQPSISTGTYAYTSYSYSGRVVLNQLSSTVSHIQNLITTISPV